MNEKQLRKILKENNRTWEEFLEWMHGQTMSADENGETNYYDWDVDRFIKHLPIID